MPNKISSMKSPHMKMLASLLCLVAVGFKSSRGARVLLDPEMKTWSGSTKNDTNDNSDELMLMSFKKNRTDDVALKKEYEVVYNVLLKGKVSPSGPSHKGNAIINGQHLSKSKSSPAVAHMQFYNGAKSRHSSEMGHMQQQQGVNQKRILKSAPSPGAGH